MADRNPVPYLLGGATGAVVMVASSRAKARPTNGGQEGAGAGTKDNAGFRLPTRVGTGSALGAAAGGMIGSLARWPARLARLEQLMPEPQISATCKQVVKPTPDTLFADRGTGSDFETRLSTLDGYLVPNDRFFIRSHSPTPRIDVSTWRLAINGSGVRKPMEFTYDQISAMPQVTLTRTIECSGNGRQFFKEAFGVAGEGGPWRTGAIGAAEWTGVRLRDVLAEVGLTDAARDVMPKGLDDHRVRRPMPLAKALADDTLLVLKMNGEVLPPDHGFPPRVLVSG